jgi:hypothetical protein
MMVAAGYLIEVAILEPFCIFIIVMSCISIRRIYGVPKSLRLQELKKCFSAAITKVGISPAVFAPMNLLAGVIGAVWFIDRRTAFRIYTPGFSLVVGTMTQIPLFVSAFCAFVEVLIVAADSSQYRAVAIKQYRLHLNLGVVCLEMVCSAISATLAIILNKRSMIAIQIAYLLVVVLICTGVIIVAYSIILKIQRRVESSKFDQQLQQQKIRVKVRNALFCLFILDGVFAFSVRGLLAERHRTLQSNYASDPSVYLLDLTSSMAFALGYMFGCIVVMINCWIPNVTVKPAQVATMESHPNLNKTGDQSNKSEPQGLSIENQ